jgi:hypothetical protein
VFVLDAQGRVAASLTRLQWQPEQVLAIVEELVQGRLSTVEPREGSTVRSALDTV